MSSLLPMLTLAAAVGSGLMAGFFYSFSNVVMGSLGRISAPAGIAAMQSINIVVLNPIFFVLFFGTALLSVVLFIVALANWGATGSGLTLAGSAIYLAAIIGVTVVFNVPMNNALAAVDPASTAGSELWTDYLNRWTLWNHVRTFGGAASMILFVLALMR